jgi:VanZ family protein
MNVAQSNEAVRTVNLSPWIPVILWAGVLFLMSTETFSSDRTYRLIEPVLRFFSPSISAKEIAIVHTIVRKLAHVTEYFIFGILFFRAVSKGAAKSKVWRCVFWSLLVVTILAAADEYHQSFVVTRTGSVRDIAIDVFGGLLALGVSVWWFRQHRDRRTSAT